MKNLIKVLSFELNGFLKNKVYVLSTVIIAVLCILAFFIPTIIGIINDSEEINDKTDENSGIEATFALFDPDNVIPDVEVLEAYFADSKWQTAESEKEIKKLIDKKEIDAGFFVKSDNEYVYYVENNEMFDENQALFEQVLLNIYRKNTLEKSGYDYETVSEIYNTQITSDVEILGKDSVNNYIYTYIMIMIVYMMVVIYGQLVATSVASEKSNRTMEVLVTSTDTNSLIFGKVFAGAIASLFQMLIIISAALIGYNLNKDYINLGMYFDFNIPINVMITFIAFVILGYLFYAFIFGALGALVSKTEDINTSSFPLTMIIVLVFCGSMMGLMDINGTLMKVLSFIPFSSCISMFARVSMGEVSVIEVIISFVILALSTVLVGLAGAKIYRLANLKYGNPIKLRDALRWLKKS